MTTHLDTLHEAVARLDGVRAGASDATVLGRPALVAANDVLGVLRRIVDALHTEAAAGIAHESRTELGSYSLAKQQGFRTPARLIASTTGTSAGEASRLVAVGVTTDARTDLVGAPLPPRYPHIQKALSTGALGAPAAALLVALLDRVRLKIGTVALTNAEELLAEKISGLSLDEVRTLLARAEAHLDPGGVEPRTEQAHAERFLTMYDREVAGSSPAPATAPPLENTRQRGFSR